MKYIVKKGTPLFSQLWKVKEEIDTAVTAAQVIVERYGTTEYYQKQRACAGGIDAFYFPNGNPDSKVFKKYNCGEFNMFAPKIKSELFKEIEALPIVENKRLNDVINFKPGMIRNTNRFLFRPKVNFKDDYILIAVNEDKEYTSVEFMEEISSDEYHKLNETALSETE